MPESLRTRFQRYAFNFFPAYRGTGARLTYIADDFLEVRVRLPLNWRTRNYVGTIFGGSMFGAVDPIYMIMLIRALGSRYVVWDKSASIRFRKPGKATLYAKFVVTAEELDEIRAELETKESIERVWRVDLEDGEGTVCASIEKLIHIRRTRDG